MLNRVFALVASLFALVLAQAADKLAGGPVVVNVGSDTATIVWILPSSDGLRSHKIALSGLEPGKTYHYDVLGQDEGKGSFKSAPVGRAKFNFVVFGDTRTRHDVHRKVIEAVLKVKPDFVLHTGDLVSDGRQSAQWPVFFSIEGDLLRRAAFFPAIGNHERNDPQFYDFFDVRQAYYSFDWGSCHFVILNSDLGNVAGTSEEKQAFWEEQTRWLENDLRKSRAADFRFVAFHHPPFTAVKRRQGGNQHVVELLPLFEKYKVTAVFNGHDHNYQHHVKNGVHYVVTGGGGAPLYEVDAPIPGMTRKVARAEHFVEVKVSGRRARMEARGIDGSLIDSAELR